MQSPERKSLLRPLGSKAKTPGRERSRRERNDRFIPNRGGTDIENAGLLEQLNTGGSEFKCQLAEVLSVDDKRLLSFKNSRPKPEASKPGQDSLFLSAKGTSTHRYVCPTPDRVLDAPDFPDDFYRNVLDWGSKNQLVVGLEESLYMWDAETGDVNKLEEYEHPKSITALKWAETGTHVAAGLSDSTVQLFDVEANKLVRVLRGHSAQVYGLSWNSHTLTSSSGSGQVLNSDVRVKQHAVGWLSVHEGCVCGLAWSPSQTQLASAGVDKLLAIWDPRRSEEPQLRLTEHTSTIKALAWCPFKSKTLASGGGTHDHHIRVWDTGKATCTTAMDTGKPVCSLLWNPFDKEILSGLDGQENQLRLWKWPAMHHIQDLVDHRERVLQLTMSPDGCTVCSFRNLQWVSRPNVEVLEDFPAK